MVGLLIYTAAPNSEGTLGGLVKLGQSEALERHISAALRRTDQALLQVINAAQQRLLVVSFAVYILSDNRSK